MYPFNQIWLPDTSAHPAYPEQSEPAALSYGKYSTVRSYFVESKPAPAAADFADVMSFVALPKHLFPSGPGMRSQGVTAPVWVSLP